MAFTWTPSSAISRASASVSCTTAALEEVYALTRGATPGPPTPPPARFTILPRCAHRGQHRGAHVHRAEDVHLVGEAPLARVARVEPPDGPVDARVVHEDV